MSVAIPNYNTGMRIYPGLIVRYTYRVGGNSHTYHLKAKYEATLTSQPNFGLFEVLNPTTFAMTRQTALNSNLVLQPGDSIILIDTGVTIKNELINAVPYASLVTEKIYGGKRASVNFITGSNILQHYELYNGLQEQKLEGGGISPFYTKSFSLEVLNAPDNFTGYVKIINKNDFRNIRTSFPVQGLINVPIIMSYPSDVTVTATYDTGSSYLNDPDEDDFFYLKFERVTSNLIVTKHPINTIPNGI